jgi:hypothetical protein
MLLIMIRKFKKSVFKLSPFLAFQQYKIKNNETSLTAKSIYILTINLKPL